MNSKVVFVTNLPAFYKVNLYEALAKKHNVFVVFIGQKSQIRTGDFNKSTHAFPHVFLHNDNYEHRSRGRTALKLYRLLKTMPYQHIVLGGWDLPEYWLAAWLSPHANRVLCLESSIHESRTAGWAANLKRYFMRKMDVVLASGTAHLALAEALGFQGRCIKTDSVGLIHRVPRTATPVSHQSKFLYLGRLAPEKNITILLQAFEQHPEWQLTIIGNGPLAATLKSTAGSNIQFISHVENEKLGAYFATHDALILPSLREPWGLVVEEAIYHRRPVIVSSQAGIADWVGTHGLGVTFSPDTPTALCNAIQHLQEEYSTYRKAVHVFDFEHHMKCQQNAYLQALV